MFVNLNEQFPSKIFLKRSTSKIVEIPKLISAVGTKMKEALLGLHAFTGCDTVSAFSGKGKVNPFKMVMKNDKFIVVFSKLGSELGVGDELSKALQEFTCQLYGRGTKISSVNTFRYDLFAVESGALILLSYHHVKTPCDYIL